MLSSAAAYASDFASGAAKWILKKVLRFGPIPKHVAFIMDGNRRFARKTQAQLAEGHNAGEKKLQETLQWCLDLGIDEVTVFAFSIENFKRSEEEVNYLMNLAAKKVKELISHPDFRTQNRIRVFGDLTLLPIELQESIAEATQMSKNNPGAVLNICFSYTSTHEITGAIKGIAAAVESEALQVEDISFDLIEQCLYTHDSAPVDLLIRTSGEIRLSDFMLWQSSSSVLSFVDVLWPEFSVWDLYRTMVHYQYNYQKMQGLRRSIQSDNSKRFPAVSSVVGAPGDASAARIQAFVGSMRSTEEAYLEARHPTTKPVSVGHS